MTTGAGVRLAGTGMSVPDRVVTNDDLARFVDTNDEWIAQRTGIRQRYQLEEHQSMRDLARQAVGQALRNAGVSPSELELLIIESMTTELICTNNAERVVAELGASPAGAMDINVACSGFVYGMNTAAALIKTGHYRHVAVVGVEVLTRILDWNDRRTCVLFGDGAGAAVLSASDNAAQGCLYQSMGSDGGNWQELYVPRCEKDVPQGATFNGTYGTMQMNGREVYKFAVTTLGRCIDEALEACGLMATDLAMVVPHQSNARILESARDKLGLPEDKVYINIDRYGNTSAASVPICLHELMTQGRLKAGDIVLMVGLGGGMTWGTSVWRL